MKALVRKCSNDKYWYKDKIGEYFDVLHSEEYVRDGTYSLVMIDHAKNTDSFTAGIAKEDCLVFKDNDIEKVQAAFDKLEKTLQKLSL